MHFVHSGLVAHIFLLAQISSALAPAILILCIAAGIGTVFLLPGPRETSMRKVGGAILVLTSIVGIELFVRYASGQSMGIYFWIFSAIALFSSLRVVTHPRPVYSALYFVLTIMATAGLFILLWAEFMAAALVIIYAGAILITYVFVIMLAAQTFAPNTAAAVTGLAEYDTVSREPLMATGVGFALMGALLFVILARGESQAAQFGPPGRGDVATAAASSSDSAIQGNTQELGNYLFQRQSLNLELAGLILTVAMVGAIVIARRRVDTEEVTGPEPEVVLAANTPLDDSPHSIPVYGTDNPRQKAYPEK